MKFTVTVSGEISAEEILNLAEGIEKLEQARSEQRNAPSPVAVPKQDSWTGKTVKIKSITPDSEIDSWNLKLERDVNYGVSDATVSDIRIQRQWFKKIWFDIK